MIAGSSEAQSLTTTEEGVIGGAALGAGTGAIVGAGVHHAGKGALIGAGLGAVTGGVVGHELQNQQNAQRRLQSEVSAQQRQIDHQRAEIEQLKQDQPVSPDGPPANQHPQETD
jgi:outer membrane lipoprotein SlyB